MKSIIAFCLVLSGFSLAEAAASRGRGPHYDDVLNCTGLSSNLDIHGPDAATATFRGYKLVADLTCSKSNSGSTLRCATKPGSEYDLRFIIGRNSSKSFQGRGFWIQNGKAKQFVALKCN